MKPLPCLNNIQRCAIPLIIAMLMFSTNAGATSCKSLVSADTETQIKSHSSYNQVVEVMKGNPYDEKNLPIIPLQMFKWVGQKLNFFVATRSLEILKDKRDFREVGQNKPIHPMGVGLIGTIKMYKSRWTGIFRGGSFPIVARASISQGNPFKYDSKGKMQLRSTAMAIKIFGSVDPHIVAPTANAVFQNDLNGLLGKDRMPLNFLESSQTNQPDLDPSGINELYQVQTLIGVAYGSIFNSKDHTSKVPFINPRIRPVHSWAEMGETDPRAVKTPIWVKIVPRLSQVPIEENDFRLEIIETLKRDGNIVYDLFASDRQDGKGNIHWVEVGKINFNSSILSEKVDRNLLFPHDSFHSQFTGEKFKIPVPRNQYNSAPDDIQ